LLILEAGGRVGTLTGEPYTQGGHIVAGTPKVFDALVGCISPHVPASLREA
jgi:myo-inositol-1(or 4)-monophosphatase